MISNPAAILARFGIAPGKPVIGGRDVREILKEHGSPLYLYSRDVLKWRHAEIRKHLPKELAITYAVKANPHAGILKGMGALYDGIDLASVGEMKKALAAGLPAAKMSFAGPGKRQSELEFAIAAGIGSVSIESERELEHIRAIAKRLGQVANVMIRVNPAFELSRSGLKMGGGSKVFGIDSERVPDVIKFMEGAPEVRYRGIHIFSGTQNLDAASILEAAGKILEYATELRAETGRDIELLNMGGGFGIPYFKGDAELDLQAVGEGYSALLAKHAPQLSGTHFKIELGRYLAGEAGLYLATVLYRKVSRGGVFLVLDGGMHHHLPASGNISLSPIRRQMQAVVVTNMEGAPEKVSIAGPLCTPLDVFAQGAEMPQAGEGDVIAILNAGAYGYSISPLGFLSHEPPREVLL